MAPSAPGARFAQFFPAAPRAARDKATERERAKYRAIDGADGDPRTFSAASTARPHRDSIRDAPAFHDGAHQPTDDGESMAGDILNGVGSASSHASTASSVFSGAANPTPAIQAHASNTLTPLTNADSPIYPPNPASLHQNKQQSSVARAIDAAKVDSPKLLPSTGSQTTLRSTVGANRVPARDPSRQDKGMKCTHDPLTDKKLCSSERKSMKPTYKTFGAVRNTILYNICEPS
jgi:[histone H3]-lysine4 N-trimethyltransferase SETD1